MAFQINDPEEIDWAYFWAKKLEAKKDRSKDWNKAAPNFGKSAKRDDYHTKLIERIDVNKEKTILDLGCGTGGDVFGLLSFLEDSEPSLVSVKLLAIDGNQMALRFFEIIMTEFRKHSRLQIDYRIGPIFIESEDDLNLLSDVVSDKYDLILSCKAICEMLAKGRIQNKAYKQTASILSKRRRGL